MSKPVIFIDMTDTTHVIDRTARSADILNPNKPGMFDIEIETGKECDGGYIQIVRDENRRGGLFIVNIDRAMSWLAPAHCVIYRALEKLFEGYLAIEYVANQVGVYRFHVIIGNKDMINSSQFQTPSSEGFESTLTGIETKDQVRSERLELKAEQLREELRKLSSQLDTLEGVKERLPTVYETDYRSGLGLGYIYGNLHFYVNLIDGEIDQAAVLHGFQGEAVGIFFYENVFVTKQQMIKQKDIELSMLSPVDFSMMLENYSDIADAAGGTVPHFRSARSRSGRERDASRRDRGSRGR